MRISGCFLRIIRLALSQFSIAKNDKINYMCAFLAKMLKILHDHDDDRPETTVKGRAWP